MIRKAVKLVLAIFFKFLLFSEAFGQPIDSTCSYWFQQEWQRQDYYDSSSNSTWTYFSHFFPDSTYNAYLDFDENGVKYLDSAYIWLKRYHYDLYRNISPTALDSLFHATRKKAQQDSTINPKKFYRLFREFIASIGDGHTTLLFYDYNYYLEHGGHLLPFSVVIRDDKILIYEVYSDTVIQVKDQILEINGISHVELLNQLQKLAFADSERPEFKTKSIAKDFDFLLWTIFDRSTPCYHLKLKREPSDTLSHTVKGITVNEYDTLAEYNPNDDVLFAIHDNRKVALLGLPTLDFDKDKKRFRKKIRETFKIIRKKSIDTLIIDIMDNPGGTCDNFLHIMKYLVPRDSLMELKIETRAAGKAKKRQYPYYYFHHYKQKGVRHNKRFKGTTILLTNNSTFSAAGDFADYFKAYKIGPVIGHTHSNVNNLGSPIMFPLSDIYIVLYIPRSKFISPAWIEKGSLPDIEINPADYLDVLKDEWVVQWWW